MTQARRQQSIVTHSQSPTSQDVTAFWIGAGPDAWYKADADFDQQIRDRFGALWDDAAAGKLGDWATNTQGALALIILTDQFPRNMFRGEARAFATDAMARKTACYAIDRGWDIRVAEPERQFFYMPFMHSERLTDQDHSVRLIKERMAGDDTLLHARAHREIIRTFNRFPYRNAALGRASSSAERDFIDGGGYGAIVSALKAA